MAKVRVVRIYITEGDKTLKPLMHYLREEHKIKGVTVFRGITGFGQSGVVHESSFSDLIPDLPLVVEFFDTQEVFDSIGEKLNAMIEPGHMITWLADDNRPE